MLARSGTALILALLLGSFATSAGARSSTVSIVNEDGSAATPATPLQIADTDYPLESVLSNEEGMVTLGLQIGADGKVAAMRLVKTSGAARLDQQAAALVRTRLAFRPGQGSSAQVEVNWKLPLKSAADVYVQTFGFDVTGKAIVIPGRLTRMLSTDFPLLAIQNREQGEGAFRVQVLESGEAGDITMIDSTGYKRLDDSARALLKRAKYQPGTIDGKSVTMTYTTTITFAIADSLKSGPLRYCHSQPIIGDMEEFAQGSQEGGGLSTRQWFHLIADGTIDDVVVLTQQGWMHMSAPLVAAFSKAAGNTRAGGPTYGVRTNSLQSVRRDGRPASCWYTGGRDRVSVRMLPP